MKIPHAIACVVSFLCLTVAARSEDVATLTKQLQSPDSDVRRAAVKSIADMGKEAKSAAPALVTALKDDKDLFVRRFAAQALGQIGADPAVAVPALSDVLREDRKELVEAAITSLGKLGPAAVPSLITVLKKKESGADKPKGKNKPPTVDPTVLLRDKAAQALGNIGPDAKDAVPALIDALKDTDVRADAATALGNIGPNAREAIPALTEAAQGKGNKKDMGFKQAVTEALGKIKAKN